VFAEPASCVTLAGLMKLSGEGRLPEGATVVMILTGNGLKDPDTALAQAGTPVKIGATLEELLEALDA
jgi:threonine synthase